MEKQPLLPQTSESAQATEDRSFLRKLLCWPSASSQKIDEEFLAIEPSDNQPLPELPFPQCQIQSSLSMGERLRKIRQLMKEYGIAVYIVPSEDEHQSEETALADKRRDYLSGFNGSAGICVITLDDPETLSGEAALSTDGRYFLQAEKQLDPKYWRLLKQGSPGYPSWQEFAITKAAGNKTSQVISCDPKFISLQKGEFFASAQSVRNFKFKPLAEVNLVDEVWGSEKPPRSMDPVYALSIDYAGELAADKVKRVRGHLADVKASHLVLTALDDIGWILNLRADTDIPFSPFFFSYAIVTQDKFYLYAKKEKLVDVREHLDAVPGMTVKSYEAFYGDLATLSATVSSPGTSIIFPDKDACNYALLSSIPDSIAKRDIIFHSLVAEWKLVKNSTELFNARLAQSKDSLAFIIFSAWLESEITYKKKKVTEYEAAQKIYAIRSKLPNFKGLSYETIASTGPNAAIIHYAPTKDDNAVIDPTTPFLVDSGGHYLEGTTDITRTYKFGYEGPMKKYRKLYTLVLKGHLSVALAKFPPRSGATGTILDAYARQPLWDHGLDFNHGTGHGVGSFGNVHEGPLYISTTSGGTSSKDYFKKGSILTDEPGYYIDGECGFRIESELEVAECPAKFGLTRSGEQYLGFNYLTKVPFCLKLIDTKYLSPIEKSWINDYHAGIRAEFASKLLSLGEKRAHRWLLNETRPI